MHPDVGGAVEIKTAYTLEMLSGKEGERGGASCQEFTKTLIDVSTGSFVQSFC